MPITVRKAEGADVPSLVRLINRAYEVERFFVTGERTTDADVSERMARPHACFLVMDGAAAGERGADAHGGEELAGAVYVQVKGDRGFLAMLSVDPARQKTGLARVLISAVEQYCRDAGCRFLDLDIVNVRHELPAFYARFGFAPFDTAPFHDSHRLTRPVHLVLMTKPLVDIWA